MGETSRSVQGQPARLGGVCFGEWEERSDWPSLAMRRGYTAKQEVVTIHGSKGTVAINDPYSNDHDRAYLMAKSMAAPMGNLYVSISWPGETVILVNPMWAERFGKTFPTMESLQQFLYDHAWQPVEFWPEENQKRLRDNDRVDSRGRVYAMTAPDRIQPVVCGGLGNLQGTILPSWGESVMQSSVVQRVRPLQQPAGQ